MTPHAQNKHAIPRRAHRRPRTDPIRTMTACRSRCVRIGRDRAREAMSRHADVRLDGIRFLPPVLIAGPLGLAPQSKSPYDCVGVIAETRSRRQAVQMLGLAAA